MVVTTTVEAPAAPDAAMAALVARVQAGDNAAFGDIYRRYYDTIFRFVYCRVGSRPTAEDLTGDVFLRALQRIDRFRWQGRDLGAWLVTIARNRVADYHKGGFGHYETTTGAVVDQEQVANDHPEDEAISYLIARTLWAAVRRLTPEQCECLRLRFLLGLSVTETCAALGSTEAAVKALTHRATQAIASKHPDLARTTS